MAKIETGGAAFAAISISAMGDVYHQEGMSLRDYFAAKALAGLIAYSGEGFSYATGTPAEIAKASYIFADAMLVARGGSNA